MKIKTFEIRDSLTFIPAMAIQMGSRCEAERWLFARSGYASMEADQDQCIILMRIDTCEAHYDLYEWKPTSCRTMAVAHSYLLGAFDIIADSGDVIDVEYILKETPTKKVSERIS